MTTGRVLGAVDPKHLLDAFGMVGLFAVLFAETGLLIGFFLPGDSLLVFAGLVCATPKASTVHLNLPLVLLGCCVAAIVGAQVGYEIGERAGPALFRRPDSRLFKQEYVEKAHGYFERYGTKTIVIARFIPIVRTFANVVAGVGAMEKRTFTIFNVVGGVLWVVSVTMLGYVLGKTIPSSDKHLLEIEAIVIALSLIPVAVEAVRARRRSTSSSPS
jgi:membrane-associated protein